MTSEDAEFAAAIHLAAQPNYLGNPAVIDQVLKDLSMEVMARWHGTINLNSPAEVDAGVERDIAACRSAALIFLGANPDYTVMPGWNRPGIIDEFIAEALNLEVPDPISRVAAALLSYLQSMWGLVGPWKNGALADAHFQVQLLGLVRGCRNLLMGVVEPTA